MNTLIVSLLSYVFEIVMFCACCGIIIFAVYVPLCEAKRREYCCEAQRMAVGEAQRNVMKPKKRGQKQSPVKRVLCQISKERAW
jgi:hypothetical protein